MPELPEVETIRRGLVKYLPGRKIDNVVVTAPKIVARPDMNSFLIELRGQTFQNVGRQGKILVLELDYSAVLVRLGMTGQLTFRTPERTDDASFTTHPITGLQRAVQHAPDKHTHLVMNLSDGTQLCYRDVRKFGRWLLYGKHNLDSSPELQALGPDPLTSAYTYPSFKQAVKGTTRNIKAVLLDQGIVAGLGNIYADEVLFACHLRPTKRADKLTEKDCHRLFDAIPCILQSAIDNRGTTFSDYRDADGEKGSNVDHLHAYGRYGQPCLVCGTDMQKSTVAGRTSTWCPKCQR